MHQCHFLQLALGVLSILEIHSTCTPSQVIITPGRPAASTMWVSWVTVENCTSVVELTEAAGDDATSLGDSSVARVVGAAGEKYSTTYKTFGFYESDFIHHVRLDELQSASTYTYRAGGQLIESASSSAKADHTYTGYKNFRTPLAPGSRSPLRFAIVGDLGQTTDSLSTVHEVRNTTRFDYSAVGRGVEPSLMMLVGDLSYADGFGPRWDSWGELMSPVLSELPLVAFSGNHEVEEDSVTHETFMHFRKRFPMPESAPEQTAPAGALSWSNYDLDTTYDYGSSYFSFDTGMVHSICLNAYTHTEEGSLQYEWLESDLAAVDREATPWVLVFVHGPWYNSNKIHQSEVATTRMKAAMEPLLHQYRVAAVWAGHVHAYERTHPVYMDERNNASGTVYVTIGDGGNREGLYDHWEDAADWIAVQNGQHYGRGDLLVVNETHARWQWWPNGYTEADDEAWLLNPHAAASEGSYPTSYAALVGAAIATVVILAAAAAAIKWLRAKQARSATTDKAELLGNNVSPIHGLEMAHRERPNQRQGKAPSSKGKRDSTSAEHETAGIMAVGAEDDEETIWENT